MVEEPKPCSPGLFLVREMVRVRKRQISQSLFVGAVAVWELLLVGWRADRRR